MKHLHSLSLIALFTVAISFTSCKDDKGLGTFTATLNGESWSAIAPTGVKTGNRLTITGLSLDKQIIMNIGGTNAGTYDMSLVEGSYQPFAYTPNVTQSGAQQTYFGTSGSIELTSFEDNRASGNFNLTATNSALSIINANGQFTDVRVF